MNKIEINDQVLDDLVSGELRGDEYRQVLLAMEARPQMWRACALAFLREQAIQQDLRRLAEGDVDWNDMLTHPNRPAVAAGAVAPRTASASDWGLGSNKTLLQRFAVLAALLLVSFSVGWMGAGGWMGNNLRSGAADGRGAGAPVMAGVGSGLVPNLPSTSLTSEGTFRDELAAHPNHTLFPVVGAQIPPELIELQRAGRVHIETFEALVPIPLENGGSAIVPVLEYRVVPLTRSY